VHFDDSISPLDLPAPPSPDEVARDFPGPVIALASQNTLEEASIGTTLQRSNGREVMRTATITYTLWRNPLDYSDPANLAELSEETRSALGAEPIGPLPDWMIEARDRMRYPALWDAVSTTRIADASAMPWHTAEHALVEHVNYIVTNSFREERVRDEFPGELVGPVTERSIERGIPVSIDGVDVSGMRIDTDAHVFGIAADLGDRVLTAAIARDHLPFVRLEFVTRPAS
jgi:hypothetical protein